MKTLPFLLSICICLAFSFQINAQKLRDKNIAVKYVQLPEKLVPEDYLTYSVNAIGGSITTAGTNRQAYANGFKMHGFKKLNGEAGNAGHLRIEVNTGYAYIRKLEVKSRTKKTKDKEGNESSKTYFYYEVPFTTTTSCKIIDPNGEYLYSVSEPISKTYESSEYVSAETLKKNSAKIEKELRADFATDAMAQASSQTNRGINMLDFRNSVGRDEIFIIKGHASEAQFEKHYQNVKSVFDESTYRTPSEEILERLQSSIDYYNQQASKNPRGNKKLKRIYKAANYNLALIYYYTDMMDKAKEYANNVIASEGKDAKSKRLISRVDDKLELFELHSINTIHHTRDFENAIAPSKMKELEAEKEEMAENSKSTEAKYYRDGKEVMGTIMIDKDAEELVFGKDGNVKFMIEEKAELKEVDLMEESITAFYIGDRKFKKIRFAPSAKGKQETSLEILEEIYASDKIKLFKYFPSAGELSDQKAEFAYKKASEDAPLSLESTQFLLWNKGLGKYFGDCADLKEMTEAGGIQKTKEDLLKAARIYSELCD